MPPGVELEVDPSGDPADALAADRAERAPPVSASLPSIPPWEREMASAPVVNPSAETLVGAGIFVAPTLGVLIMHMLGGALLLVHEGLNMGDHITVRLV